MQYTCNLCPRRCSAPRGDTGAGFCGMGARASVARIAAHMDEEPIISGTRGSGAVFFSGCALRCRFCQNHPISHGSFGREVSADALRAAYLGLIEKGMHNINLVNPTHFTELVLASLRGGLPVPVIWNTGGYERRETIARLEGHVQVYLPDLKYIDKDSAAGYSAAADYFQFAAPALKEMLRQTGPVKLNADGTIASGTIVRHLILPGRAEESMRILSWIYENLPGAWLSLMAQYVPMGDVSGVDELGRRLTQEEYDRVVAHMIDLGFEDGFVQELSSSDEKYIPKFDLTGVPD